MLVSSFNNKAFDALLTIQLESSTPEQQNYERKGDITRLTNKDSGAVVGYNFFKATQWLDLAESGPVVLTKEQVAELNTALEAVGFEGNLEADTTPKFVVGHVLECEPMEDSDHLSITKTEVDNGEILQIVCGAPNVAQGQKVVVAKPGAIMPDGLVIWAGELRGTPSVGMITSARELGLDLSEAGHRGILVLEDEAQVGAPFEF